MGNLDTRVKKLEKQCGETRCKAVLREDGDTEEEARERAGLADWAGQIIFISPTDAEL